MTGEREVPAREVYAHQAAMASLMARATADHAYDCACGWCTRLLDFEMALADNPPCPACDGAAGGCGQCNYTGWR